MGRDVGNGEYKDVQLKLRRDTMTQWYFKNPILGAGEMGLEVDTNKIKIGDGLTRYDSLPYFGTGPGNGSVTSVAANIGAGALSISGSPITTSGTFSFAWTGNNTQQVLGDGSLATRITNNNQLTNGAGYITSAALTGYVPYTGATANVDLGSFGLIANRITLTGNGPSPVNGDFYYTTGLTFNLYSDDVTNINPILKLSNSTNSLNFLLNHGTSGAGVAAIYCPTSTRLLFLANSGSTVNYEISSTGNHSWVGGTDTSGSTSSFVFVDGTKTNQTASAARNVFVVSPGSTQWATGALAVHQAFMQVNQPTMTFVGASTATFASNLRIVGGVIAGTNATITENAALYIDNISSVGAGTGTSYGLYCRAQGGAATNFSAAFEGSIRILGSVVTDTVVGMQIATTANQLLTFWGGTPVVQPTVANTSPVAVYVSGGGTALTDTDTFGPSGWTWYEFIQAIFNTNLLNP
jgi:hypothetical protein